MHWQNITGTTKGAVICAILGFVISFSSTSSSSLNGDNVTCTHMDIAALIFGALAIGLGGTGGLAALLAKGGIPARWLNFALCDIATIVGLYHVARGLGMIGGPCG